MKSLFILCLILVGATACEYTREERLKNQVSKTNDTLLINSIDFLLENLPTKTLDSLLIVDTFFINDIKQAVYTSKDSIIKGKIPFDIFAAYVLPIQATNEPIEYWREDCVKTFGHLKGLTTSTICDSINHWFKNRFHYGKRQYPFSTSWSQLKVMKQGDCFDMAQAPIFPLRALGIPATIDFTYAWGNANGAHLWNVVYIDGKMKPFMGIEEGPNTYNPFTAYFYSENPERSRYRYPAKIYRKTPVINKEIALFQTRLNKDQAPDFLTDSRVTDVTAEYFPVSSISLPMDVMENDNIAYLSIFNSERWKPIAASNIINNKIEFKDLKRNMLYLPSFFENRQVLGFDYPFVLTDNGSIHKLMPSASSKENLTIHFLQPLLFDYLSVFNYPDIFSFNDLEKMAGHDQCRKIADEGRDYYLYIWDNNRWESFQKGTAKNRTISFNDLPSNALFHIADQNMKLVGRPFTIEKRKMIWW